MARRTEKEIQEALRSKEKPKDSEARCPGCFATVDPITLACRCFRD